LLTVKKAFGTSEKAFATSKKALATNEKVFATKIKASLNNICTLCKLAGCTFMKSLIDKIVAIGNGGVSS
jgi:hypothetical protein